MNKQKTLPAGRRRRGATSAVYVDNGESHSGEQPWLLVMEVVYCTW
jgi:hypothetical protein